MSADAGSGVALVTACASRPRQDGGEPFMTVSTFPPDLLSTTRSYCVRGKRILGGVPFSSKMWVLACQVVDASDDETVGADWATRSCCSGTYFRFPRVTSGALPFDWMF